MKALLLLLALGSCATAVEEEACSPRDEALRYLAQEYREAPILMGLSNQGHVMELLVGRDGTWTLVRTDPQGRTCLTDAGSHFQVRRR